MLAKSTSCITLILFLGVFLFYALVGVWGVRKKRKGIVALAVGLCVVTVPVYMIFGLWGFLLWHIDNIRGWELRMPIETDQYMITLIQRPGIDFYDSFLEVTNHKKKTARVWIDADDGKWWNPVIVKRNGRIYFLRGSGTINADTTYVDLANDVIYTGYYKVTHKISELPFEG